MLHVRSVRRSRRGFFLLFLGVLSCHVNVLEKLWLPFCYFADAAAATKQVTEVDVQGRKTTLNSMSQN